MSIAVKICGLSTPESLDTVVRNDADMVGLNFFYRSPRFVSHDTARELASQVSGRVTRVGLVVDVSNQEIADLLEKVPLDMVQLHGHETPERVSEIKRTFGLPVMKVLPIAEARDLEIASSYRDVVDWFLFDAKPPKGAERPGGNAVAFDWSLMQFYDLGIPWLLAGGLTPENVAEAIKSSGTRGVDVSSGVESEPGVKDDSLIRGFIHNVQKSET